MKSFAVLMQKGFARFVFLFCCSVFVWLFVTPSLSKASAASIWVSPASGDTGTQFTLSGSGLNANYIYNVRFCSDSSCNTVYPESARLSNNPTDASGNLNYQFAISETGTIYVQLIDTAASNPLVATTTFTVTTSTSSISCGSICPANAPAGTCASNGTCAWNGSQWLCMCSNPTATPTLSPTPPPSATATPPPCVGCGGGGGGLNPILIQPAPNTLNPALQPNDIVVFVLNSIVGLGIIICLIFLVLGGIRWVMAAGDKTAIESAKFSITGAIIGLLVIIFSWVIVSVVLSLLGLSPLPNIFVIPSINTS